MSSSFAELGSFVEVSNYVELSNFAYLDPWVAAVVLTVMAVANLDSTRTGTVTRWGYNEDGDYQLLEVPEGLPGLEGARLIESSTTPYWSEYLPDGTKLTGIKEVVEEEGTNYLLNSDSPATQTTGALTAGTYTLWVDDDATGSATVSANTATITGAGSATAGNPLTFTVDTAGTVDITVVDTVTRFQLESGDRRTAFIYTEDTTSTRDAETPYVETPSVITAESGCIYQKMELTGDPGDFNTFSTIYVAGNNYFATYLRNSLTDVGLVHKSSGVDNFITIDMGGTAAAGDTLRIATYWREDLPSASTPSSTTAHGYRLPRAH